VGSARKRASAQWFTREGLWTTQTVVCFGYSPNSGYVPESVNVLKAAPIRVRIGVNPVAISSALMR
jgi:hypothetical protein